MNAETERWLPVVGYEGLYEVSESGRVRSLSRVTVDILGRARPFPPKMLTPTIGTPPYPAVRLSKDGKGRIFRLHVLVLAAFVGPRPEGMRHIRHLNGNRLDNRVCNLAYGTFSENLLDLVAHGNHAMAKKTHCPNGHEYTPENTYELKSRRNRCCRTCRKEQGAARWLRKVAARKAVSRG